MSEDRPGGPGGSGGNANSIEMLTKIHSKLNEQYDKFDENSVAKKKLEKIKEAADQIQEEMPEAEERGGLEDYVKYVTYFCRILTIFMILEHLYVTFGQDADIQDKLRIIFSKPPDESELQVANETVSSIENEQIVKYKETLEVVDQGINAISEFFEEMGQSGGELATIIDNQLFGAWQGVAKYLKNEKLPSEGELYEESEGYYNAEEAGTGRIINTISDMMQHSINLVVALGSIFLFGHNSSPAVKSLGYT